MTPEDGRETWSNLTINEIQAHLNNLGMRIPYLRGKMNVEFARNSTAGSDIVVLLIDDANVEHHLLFEIEQYASGSGLADKVARWAARHNSNKNTTTVVVSLVMQAFFNRLTGSFCQNDEVRRMVFSKSFRIYPGSGDGKLTDDLKTFITLWIEERL